MRRFLATLTGLIFLAGSPAVAAEATFRLIVNPANPVTTLSRDQVSRIFLKKVTEWDRGQRIAAVDQAEQAPVRATFSEAIHRRAVPQIRSYWQQQIFSGKDVPLPEKASDREVLAFVQSNPNGVGYISADTTPTKVKVVTVTE
jgi:ABC-type phosphate transport system substrate-binding protein